MKDKAPTWLKKVNQNIPIKKPRIEIIAPALLIDREKGKKFTKVNLENVMFFINFKLMIFIFFLLVLSGLKF